MGGTPATRKQTESGPRLVDRYDALLLDLDGTVFRGGEPVGDARATLSRARAAGVALRYVTNNASRAPEDVAAHLRGLGFDAEIAEVSTSAQAGAAVLAAKLEPGTEVLVVGSAALRTEVEQVGLRPVAAAEAESPANFTAVIQGHSVATAWPDLAAACEAIRAGAWWVACNLDPTVPTERGLLPGNGSMVAALRAATGRGPDLAGKPRSPLFEQAASGLGAVRPLVVGDRLDTDIEGAVNSSMDSLLVLSGVTDPAGLLAADPIHRPVFLATDLGAVFDDAEELRIIEQDRWEIRAVEGGLTVRALDTARESDGPPLDLLRALCAAWWSASAVGALPLVWAHDEMSDTSVRALGLGVMAEY
ncbi:HAD-IIA family hydrolase [Actinoalloteichus hymeniacidonis]|uniref:Sugar phosphatase of HAD superfamily n=1 Tax=Actinoalloteichus hymeniacidonis TaxID=340345 RepID=A0AAC9MZY4_9PSEU|nr:HAD-IIA family hydrolase [Actinoalloteichus hymeniacidonis]AOS64411.1 putative sugar phosphatase of HAD superfamily [Actinoalloteichus hymeniacidonis]MBB5907521.1 HAD superfamily hydrolase (TIGR01450 family) [Actinoalloteichus hymeniacidonis]